MSSGSDATGLSLVLSHLLDLGTVALLLLVGLGLGLAILERLRLRTRDPLMSLSFGTALGLAVLANGFLALGALGVLRPWAMGTVTVVAAFLGRKEVSGLPSLLAQVPRFIRQRGGWSVSLAWGLMIFGGACVFLLVLGDAPPVDWDSLMYHLPIPARFLDEGRILLPPDNLHVSFVGLLHMLYLPLLALGRSAGPALLNGALAALLGLVLFSLGSRLPGGSGRADGDTGSIALGALWGTTTLLLVAVTPRTDVSLAFYLLLAHYAFLLALEEERGLAWAGLGALLVGLSSGIKFNGLAYGAGLVPLALWVAWTRSGTDRADGGPRARILRAASVSLTLAALGVAALAPWLVKNWVLLGSPLYPYFSHRMVEPWLQTLYQANPAVAAPDVTLSQSLRGIRAPVDLWGVFFAPGGLSTSPTGSFSFCPWGSSF